MPEGQQMTLGHIVDVHDVQPRIDESRHAPRRRFDDHSTGRSEEHTSELQSLLRISYAVYCLTQNTTDSRRHNKQIHLEYRISHTKPALTKELTLHITIT